MIRIFAAGALSVFALAAFAAPVLASDYRSDNRTDFRTDYRSQQRCKNCPAPRRHYDSQEVVQTSRDVDHSRVINTTTVVPVSRKVRHTNHLVIRKNLTRNVGVVRHKHVILEKEIRYVRRVHVPITVNFVVQKYRTVHRPNTFVDARIYPRHKRYHRFPLRVRG